MRLVYDVGEGRGVVVGGGGGGGGGGRHQYPVSLEVN